MTTISPAMHSGSLLDLYKAQWSPLYASVHNLIGSTGVILPFADPDHGQPNATTFAIVGEEQFVFTWSEAPNAFDTPLDLTSPDSFQGIIPFVKFNGTDEEADSPDDIYWTRALVSASWGAWVKLNSGSGANERILSKHDAAADNREWLFGFGGTAGRPTLILVDEDDATTPNATIDSVADVAIAFGVWEFVVITYDGSANASGINIYVNGVLVASTDTDDANFVSMRDKGSTVQMAHQGATPSNLLDGSLAGGPLGPFYTQTELSADAVLRLYQLGRPVLGV